MQSPIGQSSILFTNEPFEGLSAIAEKYRGKLVFATADASEPRLLDHVGVKATDFPKFVALVSKLRVACVESSAYVACNSQPRAHCSSTP